MKKRPGTANLKKDKTYDKNAIGDDVFFETIKEPVSFASNVI